jgi:alpha-methylacyl-CoA racemase
MITEPGGAGPLAGVRVLEFAGVGPVTFAGMLLADMGAEVLRLGRPGGGGEPHNRVIARGRRVVDMDLKHHAAAEACLQLCERAEILIEGFRPGVMERLGLGPEPVLGRNPQLVYGRMTGWGQTGPLATAAGHDINFIAVSGVLHAVGGADKPVPPLNLVGDFGGGALYLAFGVLAALTHARAAGRGQVVDAAMVDGAASLMAMTSGLQASGLWTDERAANLLDGGAPFYDTYRCADGLWVAVGAIEPQFYRLLLELTGVDRERFADQMDRRLWPTLRVALEQAFAGRTRAAWCELLEGTDACFSPVIPLSEAHQHPHMAARQVFTVVDSVRQPAPAPRFSETPGAVRSRQGSGPEALADWGVDGELIERLGGTVPRA